MIKKIAITAAAGAVMLASVTAAFASNNFVVNSGFVFSQTGATSVSGQNTTTANGGVFGGGKNLVVTGGSYSVASSENDVNGTGLSGYHSNTAVVNNAVVGSQTGATSVSGQNTTKAYGAVVGGGSNAVFTGSSVSGAWSTNSVNTVVTQ